MKASRVMTKTVHCIAPATPLKAAWEAMERHRVRHLPVTWDDKVVGILSDRDLLVRGTIGSQGTMVFPELTVVDAMTPRPITAFPNAAVSKLARLMVEHRIDSVPIVGPDDVLVGMVTSTDLLELLMDPDQSSDVLPFSFALRTSDETRAA